ncbi:MAG: tetratricopeptide repeat protein, partial [Oscillospiraceae bacterium]|nr:tetratricopeptide repeat protein [Oscillospiraceae bacterium]
LANLHENQNDNPQALDWYTKAHTIYQNVYGDNHPETQDALRKIQEIQRLLNEE